ncbi:MAG TPA: arylamine N-acetyltransferase [Solirubrobacteraceae bacterium]|jgi:N-hydroxyarylamine O-acetyltransferase
MFDLDAYLRRVGLTGRPGVAELHRAHVAAIVFENLDPHRGIAVSLDVADLQRKLVSERRGGYCFEHNLLFKAALEALGYRAEPMLARVRSGAEPGQVRPRTHLLLRVHDGGGVWHADVGFGSGTPLQPLPFGPGEVQVQAGWRFRVIEDRGEQVLQTANGSGWVDMYAFVPEPVPLVDIETSNWFTSTHPRSPFVTGLIVGSQQRDGTRTSLNDRAGLQLVHETPDERTVTEISSADVPGLLSERFGLAGFAIDGDGRVVRAPN